MKICPPYYYPIEIIVLQVLVGKQKIKIINGYGPQETENKEKIFTFWEELEKEIINVKEDNCLVKLGAEIIMNDPNPMSYNGKLLWEIIQRQQLMCLNSHILCEGAITRHRKTIKGDEKAILDYLIVCDQLGAYLQRMLVDEKQEHILTKFASLKGVRVKRESDHNPLFAAFNLTFSRAPATTRREIFDFKNSESLERFSELTENSEPLRLCFAGNKSPKTKCNKFFKLSITHSINHLRNQDSARTMLI